MNSISFKLTLIIGLLANLLIQGCQHLDTQKDILKELRQHTNHP